MVLLFLQLAYLWFDLFFMTAQQKDDNKGSDNKVALYNIINEIKFASQKTEVHFLIRTLFSFVC